MMLNVQTLISSAMACLGWPYASPGSNDRSGIDCSGLFVRIFRDQGATIYHGSNTIYREYCGEKGSISSVAQLVPGMAVFKWKPETPSKFHDDLGDFCHIGLVVSTSPLQIIHASSDAGCVTIDDSLGKWRYWGKLKNVDYGGTTMNQNHVYPDEPELMAQVAAESVAGSVSGIGSNTGAARAGEPAIEETESPLDKVTEDLMAASYTPGEATLADLAAAPTLSVWSANGLPVKLRARPTTSCNLYERLPVGTAVRPTGHYTRGWLQVNWGRRKGWYMMSCFLRAPDSIPAGITIRIENLPESEADALLRVYPLAVKGYG